MILLEQGLCLEEALNAFEFEGKVAGALRFGKGHINDTFAVYTQTPKGEYRRFILQKINTFVFPDVPKLMENIVGVSGYLRSSIASQGGNPDREAMTLVKTKQGGWYYTAADGSLWRSYLFIENAVCYQKAESPALFAAAARAFGGFFRQLEGYPAATLYETIPDFHNTKKRFQKFVQAVQQDPCDRAARCKPEIEFILQRERQCSLLVDLLHEGKLPLRVTHNDTKLNNVLLDPVTLEGVCVVDLDTVMPGLLVYDFGDAIRYGANTASEDEKDANRVRFSLPLYSAYVEGFLQAAGAVMTPLEKEMMPWGARIITLELGMRFLTDYLEGDAYFRPPVPGHNLVRCKSQLALVEDMEKNWEQMNQIVLEKSAYLKREME